MYLACIFKCDRFYVQSIITWMKYSYIFIARKAITQFRPKFISLPNIEFHSIIFKIIDQILFPNVFTVEYAIKCTIKTTILKQYVPITSLAIEFYKNVNGPISFRCGLAPFCTSSLFKTWKM